MSSLLTPTVYSDLAQDFLVPTEDDLKEFSVRRGRFRKNPFHVAFVRLAQAMATRPAYVPGTSGHARNPSTGSDLSSSSNEDKPEETSKQMLLELFENIVSFPDYQPIPNNQPGYKVETYV